jgi:hypothetical protein
VGHTACTVARNVINEPPHFVYELEDDRQIRSGELFEHTIEALDPDNDPITFTVSGLPPGATSRSGGKGRVIIYWRTSKSDSGTYDFVVTASDGKGGTAQKTVHLVIEERWDSYFMPGLQYSMLSPTNRAMWGTFHGVSAEILFASWIHRNDNRGPSHGRVYLDMDVLRSTKPDTPAAFDLAFGFDLSIERNPYRQFLIPYFGLKTGAFIQKDLEKGSVWHLTPLLGVYLWSDKNLFVTGSVGYFLPVSAARFDELRGLRATVGLNFSLW